MMSSARFTTIQPADPVRSILPVCTSTFTELQPLDDAAGGAAATAHGFVPLRAIDSGIGAAVTILIVPDVDRSSLAAVTSSTAAGTPPSLPRGSVVLACRDPSLLSYASHVLEREVLVASLLVAPHPAPAASVGSALASADQAAAVALFWRVLAAGVAACTHTRRSHISLQLTSDSLLLTCAGSVRVASAALAGAALAGCDGDVGADTAALMRVLVEIYHHAMPHSTQNTQPEPETETETETAGLPTLPPAPDCADDNDATAAAEELHAFLTWALRELASSPGRRPTGLLAHPAAAAALLEVANEAESLADAALVATAHAVENGAVLRLLLRLQRAVAAGVVVAAANPETAGETAPPVLRLLLDYISGTGADSPGCVGESVGRAYGALAALNARATETVAFAEVLPEGRRLITVSWRELGLLLERTEIVLRQAGVQGV